MTRKFWTAQDLQALKASMLSELSSGQQENDALKRTASELGRSFTAIRLKWDEMRRQDPNLRMAKIAGAEQESADAEYNDEYINIVCTSKRITTVDEAIRHFKVNMDEWQVERYRIKSSEGYRKDRRVEWEVEDGKVIRGKVDDSGKILIAPMFHIQVTLKRKTQEIRARAAIADMLEDAKKRSVKPVKPKYRKGKGLWFEVDMPDIHLGKHTWAEESGEDYDLEIAKKIVRISLEKILSYTAGFDIEQVILPIGNDFFNVDGKENMTSHGTPQQEDTRWNRTFREGRRLMEEIVDQCSQIAPVSVIVVPGNHDEERSFYLGEVLDARYYNAKHITVDNRAMKRKYFHFGSNLIGFTHGYWEKVTKLPSLMPLEAPKLWADSLHREWHLGDKHHKKDLLHRTEDMDGVTIRLLRSLSATDTWHFDKAYVGTPRSAEGFLWDKQDGNVAQFQTYLNKEVI